MRSKTSYFNSALFRKALGRTIPFMIVYTVLWLMFTMIPVLNAVPGDPGRLEDLKEYFIGLAKIAPVIFSCGWSVITAMCTFSFFNRKGSALALFAMPVGRTGLFISVFSAGLCSFLCADLVVCLFTGIVAALKGFAVLNIVCILFLTMILTNFIFYGIAAFSAVLTGSTVMIPFIFAALNFLPLFVEGSLQSIMGYLRYGFGNNQEFIMDRITPVVDLLTRDNNILLTDFDIKTPVITPKYFIWAAAALILSVVASLIFRRRKAEIASELAAVRIMKPVLRTLAAVFCAIILGRWFILFSMIFSGSFSATGPRSAAWILYAVMAVGLFIGWFAAEMLLRKRFKVFTKKMFAGFAVLLLILALFTFLFSADPFGGAKNLPRADEVSSIQFHYGSYDVEFRDQQAISDILALERDILEHRDENTAHVTDYVDILYTMDSGRKITRHYEVRTVEYTDDGPIRYPECGMIYDILSQPEAVYAILQPFGDELPQMRYYSIELTFYGDENEEFLYTELTPAEFEDIYVNGLAKDAAAMGYRFDEQEGIGSLCISSNTIYKMIYIQPSMTNTIEVAQKYADKQ